MSIIPIALLDLIRWVLYAVVDGAKMPFNPFTLCPANSPDACASYEFVVDCLQNAYPYASQEVDGFPFDGIGFRFDYDETAPYAAIDLDGCRDSQTGEIEPWASKIVDRIASFTEVSRSGKG